MNETILINRLPTRTWNRLGVNETALVWGQADDLGTAQTAAGQTERLEITGSNEYSEKTVDIHAPEGQGVTVFETLKAEKNLLVRTALHVEKDAKVRLVQIQNAAQDSLLRLETSGECAENGQVELIQILLGRGDVYSDGYFELNGDGAGFNAGIGYLGQKRQTVDINLVVNHWGQKTNSEIGASGALKHDAKKIFRGTIDFKKGSAGSVGNEQETVLMLGDGVANKRVPLILCAEKTSWAITARPSASWTRTRCSISRAAASLRRKRKTSWPTPLLSVWPARLEMKRRRPRSSLSWRRCCKMAHEYRDDFPLLKSQDIAYLDNAATA